MSTQDQNLTEEIEQAEEFTVFAPTDAAIHAFMKRTGAAALDNNTLRYHVVASERLLQTDLQPGVHKKTLLGFSYQLGFYLQNGKVTSQTQLNPLPVNDPINHQPFSVFQLFVNDAQINSSNILTGKGVIHGLSSVLSIIRNRCDKTYTVKTIVKSKQKVMPALKKWESGNLHHICTNYSQTNISHTD